jgi:hypothetical protein
LWLFFGYKSQGKFPAVFKAGVKICLYVDMLHIPGQIAAASAINSSSGVAVHTSNHQASRHNHTTTSKFLRVEAMKRIRIHDIDYDIFRGAHCFRLQNGIKGACAGHQRLCCTFSCSMVTIMGGFLPVQEYELYCCYVLHAAVCTSTRAVREIVD